MIKEQFLKLSDEYTAVPVYRRLLADVLTPVSLFMNIREGAEFPFLLESVDKETIDIGYFEKLKELTTAYSEPTLPELPRLKGGAVGFSAYDTFRLVEDLPNVPDDDLNLPEAIWAFYDEIFAFDHVKHQIVLIKTVFVEEEEDLDQAYKKAQRSLYEMEAAALSSNYESRPFTIDTDSLTSNMKQDYFEKIVEKGKEYIYEGDIFQVVLSQRFEADMSGDPFMLYRALRMVNPSPYLFYLVYNLYKLHLIN